MARHLRIRGVIDVFTADTAASIRALDSHPRIDRVYDAEGPFFTRLLRARIRDVFHVEGRLWPAFLPRGDAARAADGAALHARLGEAARRGGFDPDAMERLAALLVAAEAPRGEIGVAMQQVVGRAFHPTFHASPETFAAAELLARWPRASPLQTLLLRFTGRIGRARRLILDAARGDPYCAHAVTLALPNLIVGFGRMREMRARVTGAGAITSDAAAQRSLRGPRFLMRGVRPLALPPDPRVPLRRPGVKIDVPETDRPLRRGALVRFDRAEAQLQDSRLVFNEGSWSACPARDWVPELFAELWRRSAGRKGEAAP
jgi:hypothetical protein